MNNSRLIQNVKNLTTGFILGLCLVGLTACPSPGNDGGGTKETKEAKFSLDQNTLDFGKVNSEVSFKVNNTGNADLTWTTTKTADWLTINPANGSVSAGSNVDVKITVDRSKLSNGENTTSVTVTAKQGDKDLPGSPATVQVKATKPK